MNNIISFGILGGDKRQISLINSLYDDGHDVYVSGFNDCNDDLKIENSNLDFVISKSKYIILPIPVSRDNISLNATFSKEKIIIDNELFEKLKNKIIFCGGKESLIDICKDFENCNIYDYSTREDFAIGNAIPTAEGAIEVALKEYSGTINKSNCLITGFGRIGKALAPMLKGSGANVSVSARKLKDIALIKEIGCKSILTSELYRQSGFDIIFNTIPHEIFDYKTLKSTAKNAILIDLASMPGGVDDKAAKLLNIKVIHALGLPGKVAPKTAGEIIKNTVYNIIEEENL